EAVALEAEAHQRPEQQERQRRGEQLEDAPLGIWDAVAGDGLRPLLAVARRPEADLALVHGERAQPRWRGRTLRTRHAPPAAPSGCVGGLVAVAAGAGAGAAAAVLRLVHLDGAAPEVAPVEGPDRVRGSARLGHLDEGEAARSTRLAVHDDAHGLDRAVSTESV